MRRMATDDKLRLYVVSFFPERRDDLEVRFMLKAHSKQEAGVQAAYAYERTYGKRLGGTAKVEVRQASPVDAEQYGGLDSNEHHVLDVHDVDAVDEAVNATLPILRNRRTTGQA